MSAHETSSSSGRAELTEGVVMKVARLSRLEIDAAAAKRFQSQLGDVLGYIARLSELDLEGVEPMAHPLDVSNRLDADEPGPTLPTEALMRMAPATEPPFVRVPKVLGDGGGA